MSREGYGLAPGDVLAGKYRVCGRLGAGWEGEVYLVQELGTGVERSAKIFFPRRNPGNRAVRFYAKKLHKLRDCPILIQYHTQDRVDLGGGPTTILVSEYVEGELLSAFLRRQPGRRLAPFEAMHLLHALADGIEVIHDRGEYHGDLHEDNVLVRRRGLGFELKLVDMYSWGRPSAANIREDVHDMIVLFHAAVGGRRRYAGQPPEVKAICRGLRRDLIRERFRTAGQVRQYLETLDWESR